MPRRNRVTPLGEIVAVEQRGAWMGNRGILHEGDRLVRTHGSNLWIICELEFRGRWRPQWAPHHYTHLFFLDEAVAFAAGHRPCGECRHDAYLRYRDSFPGLDDSTPVAQQLNRRLHAERLVRGTSRRRWHAVPWRDVPDGAFVLLDRLPHLVSGGRLRRWTVQGYATENRSRPVRGDALAVTPPTSLAVLRAGYPLQIDPSVS